VIPLKRQPQNALAAVAGCAKKEDFHNRRSSAVFCAVCCAIGFAPLVFQSRIAPLPTSRAQLWLACSELDVKTDNDGLAEIPKLKVERLAVTVTGAIESAGGGGGFGPTPLQVLGSRAEFEVHLVYLPTKAGERFSI
jgi:hypothetical protein